MRDNKLIQLYITNMCNSHCKTCGIWKNGVQDGEELRLGDIFKVFTAFPEADYVIGGGEAILHNNIENILEYARGYGINYTLLSNCICIEKLCKLIKEYCVPTVTVSFDGIVHDAVRGVKGNLSNIVEFNEWCLKNKVNMKISYTYSKYNEKYFEKDMEIIKDKFWFDEIYFCIAQDMDLLKTAESDESFVASNFEQILDCDLISYKDKAHIKRMISGVRRCCTSQNNVHTIYSNGDIVRCQSFNSRCVLGNIHYLSRTEIIDVLNSVENLPCKFDADCDLLCQRRYD